MDVNANFSGNLLGFDNLDFSFSSVDYKLTDSRPQSPTTYFNTPKTAEQQQNPDIKLLNNHAADPLYRGCSGVNPPNGQPTGAIIYNEQTQEYTMNDLVAGSCPIKIDYQNLVNKDGQTYYKIVREDLVPIYNQSNLASFGFSNCLTIDRHNDGKENQPLTTPDLMKNQSINQLLLANQDNLFGPNHQSNEASSSVLNSNNSQNGQQAKKPKLTDDNMLGDQAFQLFLAQQIAKVFPAIATNEAAKSDHQSTSTPVKKPKKAKSSQSTASKSKKKNEKSEKESIVTFDCPYCPKKCGNNGALGSHINKRHKEEKPFACDACSARFASKALLGNHKRSHTGKFPFTCKSCKDKAFDDSKTLAAHMQTKHPDPKKKSFACDQCDKVYAHKSSLQHHQKSHDKQSVQKEEAVKMEEVLIPDSQDDGEQEALSPNSSGVRFKSMLSDPEHDLNVIFQQPDSH